MNIRVSYLWFLSVLSICLCLPPHHRRESVVDNQIDGPDEKDNENGYSMEQLGIEYTRYLQQVIDALEKDETFKQKLENAQEHDIKSAKIADELEFVNHHVRSKLDELKRTELQRLRDLARQAYRKDDEINTNPFGHLDHENPNTFEVKDLKKLIHKVAQDLEEADKKRKDMFKTYEMEKHFEREQMVKNMTEEERTKFIHKEEEAKRREEAAAKKVHHPGSKQQLEEVWETQDHMSKNDFNPRTFFAMHDVDNNGFLDEDEVKTLFIKELDKLYASGSLQGDMMERAEEMERMREHVFNEVDKNKDRLISWEEFYAMSMQPDFNEDPGWQPLDQNQVYTNEEWQAYEQQRLIEMEKLRREGKVPQYQGQYPAQPNGGYADPNIHYGAPQAYYPQQGAHPQQMAGHPQQMAGHPPQMSGYPHQQAMPQQGIYQNQPGTLGGIPQQPGVVQGQAGVPQMHANVQQQQPASYQQANIHQQPASYQQANIPQQPASYQQANLQQQHPAGSQQQSVNYGNVVSQAIPHPNVEQPVAASAQFQTNGQHVESNKVGLDQKAANNQKHFETKTN